METHTHMQKSSRKYGETDTHTHTFSHNGKRVKMTEGFHILLQLGEVEPLRLIQRG